MYSRFRRWRAAGIWDRILQTLQTEAAHADELDVSLAIIDGSNVRAHQQAAGLRKRGLLRPGPRAQPRRVGQQAAPGDRAWRQADRLRADGGPAPRESRAIPLLEQALERMWPEAVASDNWYSASDLRDWLAEHEIEAVIPTRDNEQGQDYDREAYHQPPQTLPADRYPVRQAGQQLPGDGHPCLHPGMALSLQTHPSRVDRREQQPTANDFNEQVGSAGKGGAPQADARRPSDGTGRGELLL
jgi:hypothetical protein